MQQTITPIDGSIFCERAHATPDEIDKVISNSMYAQKEWSLVPIDERDKLCSGMIDAGVRFPTWDINT